MFWLFIGGLVGVCFVFRLCCIFRSFGRCSVSVVCWCWVCLLIRIWLWLRFIVLSVVMIFLVVG